MVAKARLQRLTAHTACWSGGSKHRWSLAAGLACIWRNRLGGPRGGAGELPTGPCTLVASTHPATHPKAFFRGWLLKNPHSHSFPNPAQTSPGTNLTSRTFPPPLRRVLCPLTRRRAKTMRYPSCPNSTLATSRRRSRPSSREQYGNCCTSASASRTSTRRLGRVLRAGRHPSFAHRPSSRDMFGETCLLAACVSPPSSVLPGAGACAA